MSIQDEPKMSFMQLLLSAEGQQFERQQLSQQYQQQQPPKLVKISNKDASLDILVQGNDQQFDYQQFPQHCEQQHPPRLWRMSDNDDLLHNVANTDTSAKEQNQDSDIIPHKPTGFLIYIPAASPDSCTMVEHICTLALSKQQVTTYQQRVNHESVPFPSPSYSALPLTLSKSTTFSDNCQPRTNNESAFSVIPDQPLNRADPQQQLNESWSGNVHGNSEPMSAPATHAATNGTTSPYPSTTSPYQPLSPTSPTQPPQPPQQGQSVQPIGIKPATRKKRYHAHVPCTCSYCTIGLNGIRNQDRTVTQKQHICHYPGCGKVFMKQHKLLVHLRRHRGEKLFICNWSSCGKKFVTNNDLQRHRLIHIGEKKYVCKECSKSFIRSDHLSRHIKTHVKGRSLVQKINSPGNSSSSGSSSSLLNQSLQQIAMTSS